jgi:hypothetical protein
MADPLRSRFLPQRTIGARTRKLKYYARRIGASEWSVVAPGEAAIEMESQATPWRLEAARTTSQQLEEKFLRLSTEWRQATGHLSNFGKRVTHIAYLKIVAMGPAVVPILLRETATRSGHWFSALHLITEANPVSDDMYGDIDAISEAWLRWGRENAYLLGD